MIPKPKFVYPLGTDLVPSSRLRGSPVRTIHHHGRSGINFTSIRGRVVLPGHTLNEPQGSAVLWVMPLDDLFPAAQYPQHKVSNRHSDKFVFLTDREAVREVDGAFFTLCYHSYWHPVFYAKFFTGAMATGVWAIRPKACAMAGHFEFHRLSWYCLTLTWNHASGHYRIYANGVLVAAEDATAPVPFAHDPCGRILYAGNPALVLSDFTFYDHEFSPEDVRKIFETNSTHRYPQIEQGLERHWGGKTCGHSNLLKALDGRRPLIYRSPARRMWKHFFIRVALPRWRLPPRDCT